MKKSLIVAALTAIAANPVMTHMRKVAYSPVKLPKQRISSTDHTTMDKAEAKRLRRQERNKSNSKTR